ncbi:MAG: hypothetical protein ACREVK_07385 [Gammaproteobacteria bacterium]
MGESIVTPQDGGKTDKLLSDLDIVDSLNEHLAKAGGIVMLTMEALPWIM